MVGPRIPVLAARRLRLLLVLALAMGLMGFGTVASAQGEYDTSGLTPVTITFTTVEEIDPGEEYEDESGFHFRGSSEINDVTGDISGTANITFNGDFVPLDPEACTEESCAGAFHLWVELDLVTETGGWDGHAGLVSTQEEGYDQVLVMLIGRGDNAGNVILLDTVVEETEEGITFAGYRLTVDRAVIGVNAYLDGCYTGPDTVGGGFLFRGGDHEDSGAFSADVTPVGAPEPGLVIGQGVFEGDHGSMNVMVLERLHGEHAFGHFVILGGTGAYEDLYGWGHTKGTELEKPSCASGFGFNEYLIGTAAYK